MTDNNAASSRQKMLDLAREHYPDRTFADLDAEQQPEGVADLDDAIDEMLEGYISRQKVYDDNNRRLTELLTGDPTAAEFVQRWVDTGDPRRALVETFGDELGMSDEARGKFGESLESWKARRAENDALQQKADANWNDSLASLEEYGNGRGWSLEEKRDVMLRLLAVVFNGMENRYGEADFDMAYKAINHDRDVAHAREAGEVQGRNARISAQRRDRSMAGTMPPASTGGQGGAVAERKPKEPSSPWAGIR